MLFLERISGIIVAGGDESSVVDYIFRDQGIKQLPNLPLNIKDSSMAAHNGTVLLCGGRNNEKQSLQWNHGTWKEHSTLNLKRVRHSAVTTKIATFIFGGDYSDKTYEYLPKDSTKWIMGKTEIPEGFTYGCAITVKSEEEIWLIGGVRNKKRILSFYLKDHTFQVLPFQLNVERYGHRCAFIPNTNKIMITGGYSDGTLDSAEMLNTGDGSVTMASPMNSKRNSHGMGVVTVNGEDRVAVFGGHDGGNELDSVELYNTQTERWEMTESKLNGPKFAISFLTVKLGVILSKLQ